MKYNLVGVDGNAFAIMAYVLKAIRETRNKQGVRYIDEAHDYENRATSSDYNNLVSVSIDKIDELNKAW